jgi:hypothetical protein
MFRRTFDVRSRSHYRMHRKVKTHKSEQKVDKCMRSLAYDIGWCILDEELMQVLTN